MSDGRRYWIGVVSRSHVERGVAGGFLQLNHGKQAPVRKLAAGDGVAIYSPRTAYPDGAPLQAFTAIGTVATGEIYQVEMAPDFRPYRVDVRWAPCREAAIAPLIEALAFIRDKTHWGAAFRFGQLRIDATDFGTIATAMGCAHLADLPPGDKAAGRDAAPQATADKPSTARSGGTHSARARTSRTTSKL
jgi:hypothetical protein